MQAANGGLGFFPPDPAGCFGAGIAALTHRLAGADLDRIIAAQGRQGHIHRREQVLGIGHAHAAVFYRAPQVFPVCIQDCLLNLLRIPDTLFLGPCRKMFKAGAVSRDAGMMPAA